MTDRPRLAGFEALRGIAALMVVGLHTQAVFAKWQPGWFSKGYLSVDFFLMLSGYLMARGAEPKLAAGLAPIRFMAARYRRFWPMMAIGSLIGTPYLWTRASGIGEFLPVFAANLMLLPWPFANVVYALNIPAWYVFFELTMNCAHVFVLRRLGMRALAVLAAAMLAGAIWAGQDHGNLDVGARPATFWHAFPRVALAYVVGMLTWRWQGPRPAPALRAAAGLAVLPGAMLASTVFGWRDWTFDIAFVLIACPLAIQGARNLDGNAAGGRTGLLARLSGAISFPLYAVNLPILEGMRELGFAWPAALAATLGAAIAIAWWTNRPGRSMARAIA